MSLRQTVLNPDQIEILRRGAEHFNHGRFFAAHEDWEIRWRKLPLPDRLQVQAGILVCGTFILLERDRVEPAARLARLGIGRFAEAATAVQVHEAPCVLDLPESENRLLRVLARIGLGETDSRGLFSEGKGLKAVVHGVS
jgi:hypothetical protein